MSRLVSCLVVLLSSGAVAPIRVAKAADPPPSPTPSVPRVSVPRRETHAMPNNYFGVHMTITDAGPDTREYDQLRWARYLVGRWGYTKTVFPGIGKQTETPDAGWIRYIKACYQLELIPVIQLGGVAGHTVTKDAPWVAPEADAPGDYHSMATVLQRLVSRLPRSNKRPLYIELWNGPFKSDAPSDKANAQKYADFLVQCSAAIRAMGDDRNRILSGGFDSRAERARALCQANPEFVNAFDIWSAHAYPQNAPVSANFHDKMVPEGVTTTIDAYLLELQQIQKLGRPDIKVMLTETGYDLDNRRYTRSAGYPVIDEFFRADYIARAFRDYWSKWPEIVAVFPFTLCDEAWDRFNWVYPDSDTKPDGSPTRPHYQYTVVSALAKPTDTTGAISGTITSTSLGTRLEGVRVTAGAAANGYETDPLGNYYLAKLKPGRHTIEIRKNGFRKIRKRLKVAPGENTIFNAALEANRLASLSGVVTSSDNNKPLAKVKITLEPGGLQATTDRRGQYEFDECVALRYRLSATRKGWHHYQAPDADLVVGQPNRLDFALGRREAPDAQNILSNPSIENGGSYAYPGIARGFEPAAPRSYSANLTRISERLAHTGRRSQQIQLRPTEFIIRQTTPDNSGDSGEQYVAGAWIYTDTHDRKGKAWITFDFVTHDGKSLQCVTPKNHVTGQSKEWIWISVESTAPPGTQRLVLNLHAQGQDGMACFDDAYIGKAQASK